MKYATISRRAAASLFDYFLIFFFCIVYILLFGEPNEEGTKSVRNEGMLPLIIVWVLYFPVSEALAGMTFGKFMANIRVCDLNGNKCTFWQALKRHLIDPVEILPFGAIAMIAARENPRKQRIGDLWAQTLVVSNEISKVPPDAANQESKSSSNQTEIPVFSDSQSQNINSNE